jgi:hypothetical protein
MAPILVNPFVNDYVKV